MSSADEISITLTNLSGMAESIVVSSTSTTLEELASLSTALGIADESSPSGGSSNAITFTVDGKVVYDASSSAGGSGGQRKLGEAGIKNGDMILVGTSTSRRGQRTLVSGGSGAGQAASAPAPAPAAASGGASGGGGLDFSALLASAGAAPAAPAAAASSSSGSAGGTGLSFNIAGLEAMSASMGGMGAAHAAPVEWPGMSLDDAMAQNPNPAQFVPLLLR